MHSSDEKPKIPLWVFIVTDFGLLALSGSVVHYAQKPLAQSTILWAVLLAFVGVAVGFCGYLMHVEFKKNAAIDERQRELEALSRTVASSAEQISIAASGLHEIAELAQKNLRHADQLPHKLQEKIAEFQAQLTQAADTEKEELERELLALRTTESERLESVSQRIAKSSAEWAKLETATQQHLAAATEAVAKLQLGTANAIGKAQAAAEQALTLARTEAARNLGESSGAALKAIDDAKAAALTELETKIAAATQAAADQLVARLEAATRALEGRLARPVSTPPTDATPATPVAPIPVAAIPEPTASQDSAPPEDSPAAEATTPASPPKRPRKTRREGPMAEPAPAADSAPTDSPPAEPAPTPAEASPAAAPVADEPPPVVAEQIAEVAPLAPETAEPFPIAPENAAPNGSSASAEPPSAPAPDVAEPEPARPSRKRPAKKTEDPADAEPVLDLDLGDADSPNTAAATSILERVLSSDGATRLLVTAYIGIGNRLFIRGEGPGLSWEKGTPLQFVSIGKWRWETNDANGPVRFKLYKNDDVECAALGTQTLEPGHQQEVTAAF